MDNTRNSALDTMWGYSPRVASSPLTIYRLAIILHTDWFRVWPALSVCNSYTADAYSRQSDEKQTRVSITKHCSARFVELTLCTDSLIFWLWIGTTHDLISSPITAAACGQTILAHIRNSTWTFGDHRADAPLGSLTDSATIP